MRFDAAILDVDGVLTHTATLHERAWKELFDEVLEQHGDRRPFSGQDYRNHVDGKPRMDGLRDFLRSRAIDLPEPATSVFPTDFTRDLPKLAQASIGQNDVAATPLQMALVAAGAANEGKIMEPHVVSEVRTPTGVRSFDILSVEYIE